ncbi:pyrroloquinoline quinone biosynthesis protein PqqB [Sinimarinibacterium sp. NLF-5-8]|uniref:pyrroloquinoline quinone biosynthesis protein PqqB n=1 Tax=Sinimarinibacterium sp. NLF-5-8 TaxID=2698684 RepID=UPI00137C2107|nr:pyrroloquinoline quinone biosynthesis protein PqqB [Sinimarinibacterium sp. NLF-5-8]
MMRAVVLGAAAGGGFPQWNSHAPGCVRARRGDPQALARTQASVAVSADGVHWFLLNASPDLRQQIQDNAILHPRHGLRSTPIAGVVLNGGDVDAIAGLLNLRERQPLSVFASAQVHQVLDDNPIFEVLARDVVARVTVELDVPMALPLPEGGPSGLLLTLFAVPGKVPLYLEGEAVPGIVTDGRTVGMHLRHADQDLFFIPGCAAMTPALAARLQGADTVLFDGTLFTDDEMIRAGLGVKTGLRMGHMSVSGAHGTLAAFAPLNVRRKVFVHINNSNPMLLAESAERAQVEAAGWIVAHDGLALL